MRLPTASGAQWNGIGKSPRARRPRMEPESGWTSPSDLADYAYCPRSHWYRHHPPAGGPSSDAAARGRAGVRYHSRTLTAERHRAERGSVYWAGIVIGVGLVALGAAWIFHL